MKTKKIITFILIVLWMILIFYFSNQVSDESSKLSGGLTHKILEAIHMLDGKTLEEQLTIETLIRKLAHFSLYAIGGIIIFLHVNLYEITEKRKVITSWTIGTTYAISDEIHQLFVPGRSGEIRDVCIDSLGIVMGITIIILIFKILKRGER